MSTGPAPDAGGMCEVRSGYFFSLVLLGREHALSAAVFICTVSLCNSSLCFLKPDWSPDRMNLPSLTQETLRLIITPWLMPQLQLATMAQIAIEIQDASTLSI